MNRSPWSRLVVFALTVAAWQLPAAPTWGQETAVGPELSDWLQTRLDAAIQTSSYQWYSAVEGQVLSAQFSFFQSQFQDGLVDSTKWLNAQSKLQAAQGSKGNLPDGLGRGSATYQGPHDSRNTLDWHLLTAAPVLTVGCRETEKSQEMAFEYRYVGGSAQGNRASIHTLRADWLLNNTARSFHFGFGVRGDAGSFDVRSPLFYYGRSDFGAKSNRIVPEVPALDYPFSQAYQKQFFAVGPELLIGWLWAVESIDITFFIRARGAVSFGNEHTTGVLTQAPLGSLPFAYGEASTLTLWDVKAGVTWRPRFLTDLELSMGYLFEGGPSTYSSYTNQGFKASVFNGGFVRLLYDF